MDLAFTPEEERFRAELRTWLGAHLPAGWTGHRAFATLGSDADALARLAPKALAKLDDLDYEAK